MVVRWPVRVSVAGMVLRGCLAAAETLGEAGVQGQSELHRTVSKSSFLGN